MGSSIGHRIEPREVTQWYAGRGAAVRAVRGRDESAVDLPAALTMLRGCCCTSTNRTTTQAAAIVKLRGATKLSWLDTPAEVWRGCAQVTSRPAPFQKSRRARLRRRRPAAEGRDKPPAFDILAWNADGTNLPGALHCEFLDIFEGNLLTKPGGLSVLGSPMQLDGIKVPTFVTGALVDHLTPWLGCYRTTQLLGGDATFVLSYSGHIASLVNPPGNPKAHYWTGGTPGPNPQKWIAEATKQQGSWWEAWTKWFEPYGGEQKPAPRTLGSKSHPIVDPAPGRYVRS